MKGRTAIAVLSMLAWSHAATAAETSFVGKFTSSYKNTAGGPAPSGNSVIATAPLPEKYSSKKNFLNITVMVQENCTSGLLATTLNVGGVLPQPDTTPLNYTECDNSPGYHMVTRTWTLIPESLGGAPVPEGSTIGVTLYASNATTSYGVVTVNAIATK